MKENKEVGKIIDYIENQKNKIEIAEFGKWCKENKLWQTFSKSQEIFLDMIEEHNGIIKED